MARPQPVNRVDLYWQVLLQIKTRAIAIRKYRDGARRRLRVVELVKAISSSSAIAGWVVFKNLPFLWSGIIVASQLLDAIKDVFPFARSHKAASDLTSAMDIICIDGEADWAEIESGRLSNTEITKRTRKLERLQYDAEHRFFPGGFSVSDKIAELAEADAKAYFVQRYGDA